MLHDDTGVFSRIIAWSGLHVSILRNGTCHSVSSFLPALPNFLFNPCPSAPFLTSAAFSSDVLSFVEVMMCGPWKSIRIQNVS